MMLQDGFAVRGDGLRDGGADRAERGLCRRPRRWRSAQSLPLIRDAEIEGLLRLYTRPIFKAAGINPKSVKVYIINDPRINAFVAGGQRIFVNTGLLLQADTPNEVIGVLAHETGPHRRRPSGAHGR